MARRKKSSKISPQITFQKKPAQDMYWTNEILETMKLGYTYELAYSLVSKKKIQELFENDVRINDGR